MPTRVGQAVRHLLVCMYAVACSCNPSSQRIASNVSNMAGGANETFHFLIVGVPLSPLHSCVSIGQELCLRGHKVTVLSFAERGRQKVEKYSKACKLNYVSLGPLPVDDEHEDALVKKGMSSNSTLHQIENVAKNLLGPYSDALALGVEKYLETAEMPTFGLVSMPFGRVGRLLEQRGLDFAVNMPTILVPPMVPWAAPYVPVPFLGVSVHDMSFLERMLVIGSNWLFNLVRVAALTVGYRFSFMPELGWDLWMGRLVFVNTIPGMDYTQPLPPLVQYTGPVVDVKKMEPFPEDVEQWLEERMCQNSMWNFPPPPPHAPTPRRKMCFVFCGFPFTHPEKLPSLPKKPSHPFRRFRRTCPWSTLASAPWCGFCPTAPRRCWRR